MTDPATLIDCAYCNAQNDPFDVNCWNCKKQCMTDERKKQLDDCEKYYHDLEVIKN